MPPSLKTLHQWEGTSYGILNDGDGQVLYYRNDVLADPQHQAAFKTEYGYDLPSPPQTWQQLLDVAKYFNGKNWDATDADPDSGAVLHLKVGEQGHYHFQSLSASFVINPGDKVTRTKNVYWFDPEDMKPLINSPGHVKALEFLQELHKTGPSAQVGWSLGEAWDYFLRGKAVFVFSVGRRRRALPGRGALQGEGQVRGGGHPVVQRVLRLRDEAVREARHAAHHRQHHRRLVARRDLELLGQSRGDLFVPVADGDRAGIEADGDGRLGRRRSGLLLPVPGGGRRHGEARGLREGGLGGERRQDLHARLSRDVLRRDHASLSAHPRLVRVPGTSSTRTCRRR